MTKPIFQVIEGDRQPPSPWLDLPQTVVGRSPFDRGEVAYFRLSKGNITKLNDVARRQPIYDAWTNIVGKVPPVNNTSILFRQPASGKLVDLASAHACFRGVRRPVGDDEHGFDTVIFVSKPKWGVRYVPSMACVLSWFAIPDDLVFVTYARLDHPAAGRYGSKSAVGLPVRGVISHWQFVEADPAEADLPIGSQERYRRRLW